MRSMLWQVAKYVGVIAALFGATLAVFILLDEDRGRGPPNPAIYPAFKAVDRRCVAEQFPHETVRCQGALELSKSCDNASQQTGYECTAKEYYCTLVKLGFDMPPYWTVNPEPGRHPCRSRWGWW